MYVSDAFFSGYTNDYIVHLELAKTQ